MKSLLTIILGCLCSIAIGGGIIGGGNPSVQLEREKLHSLQESALKGHLIRVTEPGKEPVHLRPNLHSMNLHSLRANALPSGQETIFFTEPVDERIQKRMPLNFARSLKASTGVLPIMPTDFPVKPEIIIDTVSETDLDERGNH